MSESKYKEFFGYVVPSIFAFALSGVYTIVDGFFVGQSLGDSGLAAITLGYPLSAFIQAVGSGIGLAGAIRFSILNAQRRERDQHACFAGSVVLLLLVSVLLTVGFLLLQQPILFLFGAHGTTLELTAEYMRIIALGAVFQLLATGLIPFIRNMNGASFAMAAMILGFVTNIILDYTFVWIFGWGMAGAAWATIIGQAITMLAAILFFILKKSGFYLPPFFELTSLWKNILHIAPAPFGLTFSPIITMLVMNRFLLWYGTAQDVAVYGCIGYVTSIVYLLLQGIGDGSQPLISSYYGKQDGAALKSVLSMAYSTAFAVTVLCMAGVFAARTSVGTLFGASEAAGQAVAFYLPIFLAVLLFLSYVRITTAYFYATEKVNLSYMLVYAEPLLSLVLLIALPPLFGLNGVWFSVPCAQTLTCCIAVIAKHRES